MEKMTRQEYHPSVFRINLLLPSHTLYSPLLPLEDGPHGSNTKH